MTDTIRARAETVPSRVQQGCPLNYDNYVTEKRKLRGHFKSHLELLTDDKLKIPSLPQEDLLDDNYYSICKSHISGQTMFLRGERSDRFPALAARTLHAPAEPRSALSLLKLLTHSFMYLPFGLVSVRS
ncbi:hypothetical protein J6590_052139 [Homalodisca vitripennis]|nr:hypothetical protein J6590_052139 [Homalodisca vitripennis]